MLIFLQLLKREVTLCKYDHGKSDIYGKSSISNIDVDEISQEVVKRGIRLFLEAKLGVNKVKDMNLPITNENEFLQAKL